MTPNERERFDQLLEEVIDSLPPGIAGLLEEVPVIVEDRPSRELLEELVREGVLEEPEEDLCGLHSGVAFTDRSVEAEAGLPPEIHLFRHGIISLAGGWDGDDADDRVFEEIRVTLLHELGHQFGLDEDDLQRLGYE